MKWTSTASLWLLTVVLSAWGTSLSAQTSDEWTDLFSYLQTECAEDTTGVDEACAWLAAVDACSAGDTLACDSLWAQWSTFVTDSIGGQDNGNDVTDNSDSTSTDIDDAIDTILGELQAECDADTTGSAVECDLIPLATACLGGDSLACLDWASAWMAYEDSMNDETEVNDDSDGDDSMDEDDAFENDSLDDHSDDWANILADLQNDCAQDTTGLDASCGLASTLEACMGGDSLACLEWESAWEAMGGDDHAYEGDHEDDEDEWEDEDDEDEDDEWEDEDDEDDDDEWEDEDDEDEDEDDDDEWENYGGSLESILAYLQADCAEDTTGLDESCALAAIAESCLAGDSLSCVEWDAAWMAYSNDEDEDDEDDEDGEWEGEDDGEDHDSDEDGLSDDDEVLYSTDANSPDTDGDGLSDGDEVLLFNLSPTSADTDGNGIPDPVDLVYSMLPQVNACPSDINRDGTVSIADMLLFLVDFGTACTQ